VRFDFGWLRRSASFSADSYLFNHDRNASEIASRRSVAMRLSEPTVAVGEVREARADSDIAVTLRLASVRSEFASRWGRQRERAAA
jgi:hypothetical protein